MPQDDPHPARRTGGARPHRPSPAAAGQPPQPAPGTGKPPAPPAHPRDPREMALRILSALLTDQAPPPLPPYSPPPSPVAGQPGAGGGRAGRAAAGDGRAGPFHRPGPRARPLPLRPRRAPAGRREDGMSEPYVSSAKPFNGEDRELLVRLDERTKAIHQQLETFVTKESFRPVMLIAYGMMASIALTLLGAVIRSVLG